ncbi:MAG TPA: hypothetical protein VKQ36_00755 [Ktedonobacterales bacterium]|nr:hypothetical protein [Ktedonobacterales bacterium]
MTVSWADSPSTSTPLDAANLDHLLQDDGSVTATAPTPVDVTLSGSNRVVAKFQASDGKTYEIFITTAGKLTIFNSTDNVLCAEFGPSAGELTLNSASVPTVGTHSTSGFTLSAGNGAPSSLAVGEIYFQLS